MMTIVKHVAWDNGAIAEAFQEVLGVALRQRTTKTRCGKRVSMSAVNSQAPTCPECMVEVAREERSRLVLAEYVRILEGQGLDAANKWASENTASEVA